MFEEMAISQAEETINSRALGYSQLRLLPKAKGARPIVNFKRQNLKKVNGRVTFDKSINKLLEPVHNMLTYERKMQPELLGSSMFSQGEMYPRLKAYKYQLMSNNNHERPLYFVKVDVKACFDSIPQDKIMRYISELASEGKYRLARYAVVRPPEGRFDKFSQRQLKPIANFKCRAQAEDDFSCFYDAVNEDLAPNRKRAVFVESGSVRDYDTASLLTLLAHHVKRNIVRIDQKYYRQKRGIPQGSILSSILCNFFYAGMEREKLGFLDQESLLLRHTDDFLLVTTDHQHARRFLQLMHDGQPEYGILVNPSKSLVNFEVTINGMKIARLCGGFDFPYLGDFINTQTLAISTDSDRKKQTCQYCSSTFGSSLTEA